MDLGWQLFMEQLYHFTAPADLVSCRIDVFLTRQNLPLSRSAIQRLIESGNVKRGNIVLKSSDKIHAGQTCTFFIANEILTPPTHLEPFTMPLDILFEDKHMLALNKPAGISVHPGAGEKTATLAHGLLAYAKKLSDIGGWERPGIVHRLDKDTSGILLVAKTNAAHTELSRQFAEKTVKKEYWALTWGEWEKKETVLDAPIGRHAKNRKQMAIVEGGKNAVTKFIVEQAYGFCAAVQAFPQTGRTHQIRIHLTHLNHPVVGDSQYGGGAKRVSQVAPLFQIHAQHLYSLVNRQLLHAREIEFLHPITNKPVKLSANFPDDIKKVIKLLNAKK
jgi:23S rRNA pseudouridine1911/1915/1917 synthase